MIDPERLHRWAERLCSADPTSREHLSKAIEGADGAWPAGLSQLELDPREIGLGGVWMFCDDGAIPRVLFDAEFGVGVRLARIGPTPIKYMTVVEAADAPHKCSVFVQYDRDVPEASVRSVSLRVDRKS